MNCKMSIHQKTLKNIKIWTLGYQVFVQSKVGIHIYWYLRFDYHYTYHNRFDVIDFMIWLLYFEDMLVVGLNKVQIQ